MFSVLQTAEEKPVTISWYQSPYQNRQNGGACHDYGPIGCDTM